ncbi:hypothetical protein [Coleofasciculus sp. G2-EDA-02]
MLRLYITSKSEPRQQPAFRMSLFFVRTTTLTSANPCLFCYPDKSDVT